MKALIIEDEDLAAKRLMKLLLEVEPGINLTGPLESVQESVTHLQQEKSYDILFLDIQLADGKSFSIFEKVKIDIPVIFTTAYDEFAIKAFELNCIDYLLKPVNKEKLQNSIQKFKNIRKLFSGEEMNRNVLDVLRSFQMQSGRHVYKTRFLVNKGDSLIPITTEDIAYFYAEDKANFLVTNENKRYLINHTLEDLDQKLDPSMFFRVNRQYIASIRSIHKIHNYFNYKLKLDLVPLTETEVIVSKARTGAFKAWMSGEKEESNS